MNSDSEKLCLPGKGMVFHHESSFLVLAPGRVSGRRSWDFRWGLRPARMELSAPWPAVRYRPGKGQESVGRGRGKEKAGRLRSGERRERNSRTSRTGRKALLFQSGRFSPCTDRLRSGIDARQGQQKKTSAGSGGTRRGNPLEQGGDHPLRAAARTVIAWTKGSGRAGRRA